MRPTQHKEFKYQETVFVLKYTYELCRKKLISYTDAWVNNRSSREAAI